jgi:hypothetical protein
MTAVDADIHPVPNARQYGDDQQRLQRVHKFVLLDDTSEELASEKILTRQDRANGHSVTRAIAPFQGSIAPAGGSGCGS